MKPTKTKLQHSILTLALSAAVGVFAQTTPGQGWFTVDDFQYIPGKFSAVGGSWGTGSGALYADPQGNVYVAGMGFDGSAWHGLVMLTSDQGGHWNALEDYAVPGTLRTEFRAIGIDANQNIYASGQTGPNFTWIVRKSPDHGATWTTVMSDLNGFLITAPTSIAADSVGNVFVTATVSNNWILRKSSNAGTTWVTADSIPGISPMGIVGTSSGLFVVGNNGVVRKSSDAGLTWATVESSGIAASAICADGFGNIYIGGALAVTSGKGNKAVTTDYWVILKGSAGGAAWHTVATIPVSTTPGDSPLYTLGADAQGNLYAAGSASGLWLVTKSANQGTSWVVVDNFQYGSSSTPTCFCHDAAGNLYIGGRGADAAGTVHWLVRKTFAP